MLLLRVNYEDGDYEVTRVNASRENAIAYYVGTTFNLGTETDDLKKCVSVDFLEDENGKILNQMCFKCAELGKSCAGTSCQVWTGCIYRKVK